MIDMPKTRYFYRLHKIHPAKNQYRFYTLRVTMTLFREWSLVREWGRIGSSGTVRFDVFLSEQDALEKAESIVSGKIKSGYIEEAE